MGAPMKTLLGHPCKGRCVPDSPGTPTMCFTHSYHMTITILGVGYVAASDKQDSDLRKLEI